MRGGRRRSLPVDPVVPLGAELWLIEELDRDGGQGRSLDGRAALNSTSRADRLRVQTHLSRKTGTRLTPSTPCRHTTTHSKHQHGCLFFFLPHLYRAFLTTGLSKCFTLLRDIHTFMHTFTHRMRSQQCRATAPGAVSVRCLAKGYLDTLGEAGDRTSNLLVTSRPAPPPEPHATPVPSIRGQQNPELCFSRNHSGGRSSKAVMLAIC